MSGDDHLRTFGREVGEVQLGTIGEAPTEKAEKEREEKRRITENDVIAGVRGAANNPTKRIRPLADLIHGPDERSTSGNLLFPVFPNTENTIWTPLPNLPAVEDGERKGGVLRKQSVRQMIGNRKDFATMTPKFKVSEVSKTSTPLQKVVPPSASSRIVYFPNNERKLGSESGIGFEKLGFEKLGYESGRGFDRVRLGRVSSLISKSARDFSQKKRQEGSPYRYDASFYKL